MHHHAGAHAPIFVILAIAVAILGSWAALDMFRRVRANAGPASGRWLVFTAVAFGLSIWSMHFVAMLGWDPGATVSYDPALTGLSLLLPIGASGAGFFVANKIRLQWMGLSLTALIMGAAICAMHYLGMAAVRGPFEIGYDATLVAASYVVASGASAAGLWASGREVTLGWRFVAAVGLGLAIVGMHYTGMAAIEVRIQAGAQSGNDPMAQLLLAVAVSASTLMLLIMAVLTARIDHNRETQAEREAHVLLHSERRLRALLDQMPVGALVAEAPSGRILFGNLEAERILGHAVILAEGPSEYVRYGSLQPDGSPQEPESFALARAMAGQRVEAERQLYRRGDGRLIMLEVNAAPIRNDAGQIEFGVVAFNDITQKLQSEEALRRTQQLQAVGQLTGGVAHDFNNLLTAVIGGVTMALKRIEDPKARALLDNALHGAQRGARLTAQLLAFSRKQRLETRPVDVNAMVAGMGGLLSSTLGKGVRLVFELAEDLPAAVADPTQLELAVLNLAINARDAMDGSGTLTISTGFAERARSPEAAAPEPGRYVAVRVRDTGPGMTSDVLDHAFEPFFTTKPMGKGSGLGLPQVLGLAKQMGGGVGVETEPGKGFEIAIYLPVADAAAEPAPASDNVAALPRKPADAVVLVVDDDREVRRFIAAALQEAGYSVEKAEDGPAALAMVGKGLRPDLVLMDFAMPEMTGFEAAGHLGKLAPGTPVLMMTGFADLVALPTELDRGRLLAKPFEPDALVREVDAMLAGVRRARRARR